MCVSTLIIPIIENFSEYQDSNEARDDAVQDTHELSNDNSIMLQWMKNGGNVKKGSQGWKHWGKFTDEMQSSAGESIAHQGERRGKKESLGWRESNMVGMGRGCCHHGHNWCLAQGDVGSKTGS